MKHTRIPYKNYRILPPFMTTTADRHNANEIELQVARGIVRYLERAENADKKSIIVDSARHSNAMRKRYGFRSDQAREAELRHMHALIAFKDMMNFSEWIHPDDDVSLFTVALTRAIRFYLEGSFYRSSEMGNS